MVALIDPRVEFRAQLRHELLVDGQFTPGIEASTARDALALLDGRGPDLAVVELLLPDGDAASFTRELRRRGLKTRVLAVSEVEPVAIVRDAIEAGASGFVSKQEPVWSLMLRGRTTREIAAALCVCVKTVESHRQRIKLKLGWSSWTEMGRLAGELGLRGN